MTRNRPGSLPTALLFASAAALLTAAPSLAKEYMTPGFMLKTSRPIRVAVLPPHAEFIKAKAVMTAEMLEEAAALEDEAGRAIAAELKSKGYEVRALTSRDLEAEPGLRQSVTRLNARYDEEWFKIMRKPRAVRKERYGTGEEAVALASLLQVDGLVVPRIIAVGHTGGRQALTILLSLGNAYARSYAVMGLGVLDGRSGRVEGYFEGQRTCTLRGLVDHPGAIMTDLAEITLDDYLGADEVKTPRKVSAEAAMNDEAEPDEAAISDFEAILKQKEGAAPADAPQASPAPAPSPAPEAPPGPEAPPAPEAPPESEPQAPAEPETPPEPETPAERELSPNPDSTPAGGEDRSILGPLRPASERHRDGPGPPDG